jgi:hypothetical protein
MDKITSNLRLSTVRKYLNENKADAFILVSVINRE